MLKHINIFILIVVTASIFSCTKSNNYDPVPQEILYSDTSGVTGQLTVYVRYRDEFGSYPANGSGVFLYAAYDDILIDLENSAEDLAIYRLITADNNNSAYFGFINYGNYYILAFNTINGIYYEKISIVQVRPTQHEELSITLEKFEN
ncbi:MAG: hypothetical protein GXO79_03460 [Chlorobi bacterium]|nr:hypothetical protein [Chlorobiota bacterium]